MDYKIAEPDKMEQLKETRNGFTLCSIINFDVVDTLAPIEKEPLK